MKLLVDAQLPVRLANALASRGHDVVHTAMLPDGNRITDALVSRAADAEERIVVTKDRDFLDEHLLNGSPERLLLVTTGNIHNSELLDLVLRVEPLLSSAFEGAKLVELNRDAVVIH